MNRKKLLAAVEEGTHTAVERGQAALSEAAERLSEAADRLAPLVEQAGEYVSPFTQEARRRGTEIAADAVTRLRPVISDARIRGARLAAETYDRVQPGIDEALDQVTPTVERTMRRVTPAVDEALSRVTPSVDLARTKVQHDLLPRFASALHEAASQPLTTEIAAKLAAATAALVSTIETPAEVVLVTKKKRSFGKTLATVVIAGSVLAGVVVAVRKLMADSSSGWQAHTPSDAYIANPVADVVEDVAAEVEEPDEAAPEEPEMEGDVGEEVEQDLEFPEEATQDVAESVEEELEKVADKAEGGDASPLAGSPYGPGSYVGAEPPQGFSIKGNNRSMKYHLPGTSAYERTIADVWFDSPESAEAAGFVRTQR